MAPAPLHLVAGVGQVLDAGVGRHDLGDLGAQGLVVRPAERRLELGPHPSGHVGEQAPLAAGLADLARDLGREGDAALGGGLGAAALLLVAGGHRQQDHVVARHEHLRGHHDVLVDPQRHASEGRLDPGRIGQHVEEVAAGHPQHVELAALGRLDHLGRGEPRRGRHLEAPRLGAAAPRWPR